MGKTTRFYFFTMTGIKLLVIFYVLGFVRMIMEQYLYMYRYYTNPINWIITFVRTISVLSIIAIVAYFLYVGYRYVSSKFYAKTRIPIHEAFFHGYTDLAYVYQRLSSFGKEVTADTKTRSVNIKFDTVTYNIAVRDIFGKLQGEAKDATWYIVSGKKKQYGNITYKRKKPIPNPIFENRDTANRYPKQEDTTIKSYVCLTGLRRNTFNSEVINTVYELEAILQKQK